MLTKRILIVFLCLFFTTSIFAKGNSLIEAVMRSDFIFDRNISNVPFIPLAYINYNQQNDLKISENCFESNCEFEYKSLSQGLALPVWVGQKNMLILGETLESERIDWNNNSIDINSGGVLAAWISQPSEEWQMGGFVYGYRGIGDEQLAKEPKGTIAGAVARYRHSSHFHSYWGLVRVDEYNDETLYPYIGFDWYIGEEWSISAVLPWLTVNYAPSKNTLFKIGALPTGAEWAVDANGRVLTNDFEKWDFGLAYERKLWGIVWGEVAVGYSGLGKFSISSGSNLEFETEIDNSPFIRLSFYVRVE